MARPGYLDAVGMPVSNGANLALVVALRMVRFYGKRVPTVQELQADFNIHRATAYRWRAAFTESLRVEP